MRKKIITLFLILLVLQILQVVTVSHSIRQLQSAVNKVTITVVGREVAQSTDNLLDQARDNVVLIAGMNYPVTGIKKIKTSWASFHQKLHSMYKLADQLSFDPKLLAQLKESIGSCEKQMDAFQKAILSDPEGPNYTTAIHDAAFEFDQAMEDTKKILGVFLVKFVDAAGTATVEEQKIHDFPIQAVTFIGFIIGCILIFVGIFALTKIVDPLIDLTIQYQIAEKKLKKEQETALALEQARATAQAKTDFLANMSHELRTPMNAILGFGQLLNRTDLDKNQKNYLDLVMTSGHHLIQIINDILDFSKLESGKINIEYLDFNLEELINDVMKIVATRTLENPLDTYVDYPDNLPRNIKSDPTRLKQVLVNLLGNAVKFTFQGDIGVIVRLDEKADHAPDEIPLRITVKDSGIGIPKEKINTIFESFTQVDETTTRKYGGTGLGLTITQSIIQAMGGKIWVESQEGVGSKFIFTIKVKKGSDVDRSRIDPLAKEVLAGKKVFIIDDNEIARKVIKKNCEIMKMQVLSMADSGPSGLAKLDALASQKTFPDMILCDIIMKEMYGYDIAKKLRSNKKFDAVKLVAMTSLSEVDVSHYVKEDCFDAYLTKPVYRAEMVDVLAKILGYEKKKTKDVEVPQAKTDLTGLKILVAENNVANLMLLQACLDEMKCKADYTHNGQEAVERLKAQDYDICLMDLQMPVMSGLQAAEIIRKKLNKKLPIIALTAAVSKEDEQKAQKAGMNDFMGKPINIDKLKQVIVRHTRPPQEKKDEPAKDTPKIRALVVDDNKLNMKLLVAILKRLNCQDDTAENGQEAVDKAKQNPYDICFMDIQMPVMGGEEASQIIRKEVSKDMPIIAVTAVKDFTYEKAVASGMNECLHKPVDIETLKKVISKYC